MSRSRTSSGTDQDLITQIAAMPHQHPPRDLVAAVMRRIERPTAWQRISRWLFTARPVRIVPAWSLAAAITVLMAVAWFGRVVPNFSPQQALPPTFSAAGATTQVAVEFVYRAEGEGVREVALVGSFNNWQAKGYELTPAGDGAWAITVPLRAGHHEYAFVINGKELRVDPQALLYRDDGFGNQNSVVVVEEGLYVSAQHS